MQRARVGMMVAVGLVGVVSSSIALLLAGVRARWAALPLLLPLPLALLLAQPPRPKLLAYGFLAAAVLILGVQLGLVVVAVRAARRVPRRSPRERWILGGLVVVFCAAQYLGGTLVDIERVRGTEPFRIASSSNLPNLLPGDLILIDRRAGQSIRRGDLIVLSRQTSEGGFPVRRLVALPGDVVETRGHEVVVNGVPLSHSDVPCDPTKTGMGQGRCVAEALGAERPYVLLWSEARDERWGPKTLAPEEIFVLGDNRDDALDSRHLSPLAASEVSGRPVAIWFSWSNGRVRWSRIGREL